MRTLIRSVAVPGLAALAVAAASAGAAPRLAPQPSAATAACAARALRATYTLVFGSNATGHVEYRLTLTNRSGASCTVEPPLTLQLLGSHGQALPTAGEIPGRSPVALAAGQWAQATAVLSPDLPGPGEPDRGDCEPVAHALRITIGAGAVRAAMDPTPVCEHGTMDAGRLAPAPVTAPCAPGALRAAFRRQTAPFEGFAGYDLTLRNRTATACHVNSVVGLRLLGAHGRRLATRVSAGLSSPDVIPARRTETAFARVATRGGRCDAPAPRLVVRPIGGRGLTAPISPPLAACRGGLIELSTLFHNG
jgi:hypothetical protein